MIVSFADRETEADYHGDTTASARKRLPLSMWSVAQRKLDQIARIERLDQLAVPPGNRLEMLRGGRKGQHSIRINQQYRICFVWMEQGAAQVEIVDYH